MDTVLRLTMTVEKQPSKKLTNEDASGAATRVVKKICCVCKEAKRIRDECIILNGEERCQAFIEAHKACLRSEGFQV